MHRTAIAALCATLCAVAVPAAAQKDVGEPLEHFLATKTVDGQLRPLDDPVARLVDDFNADGMLDVALWQARDLAGRRAGPVFLYFTRKDGRFAAAGSILADPDSLFRELVHESCVPFPFSALQRLIQACRPFAR